MQTVEPTVYLVDDDPSMLKSLQRLLVANRYCTKAFSSAENFLKYARPESNACVILDVNLPDLDGLKLHERLLGESGPAVIFLTGCGSVSSSVRALKQGAIDFLEKPVEEARLLHAVEQALEADRRRRLQRGRMNSIQGYYSQLTQREREVMMEVARGRLNKQIAFHLGIAEKTVKVHRGRVMEKMKASSLVDLVFMVEDLALLEDRARPFSFARAV